MRERSCLTPVGLGPDGQMRGQAHLGELSGNCRHDHGAEGAPIAPPSSGEPGPLGLPSLGALPLEIFSLEAQL